MVKRLIIYFYTRYCQLGRIKHFQNEVLDPVKAPLNDKNYRKFLEVLHEKIKTYKTAVQAKASRKKVESYFEGIETIPWLLVSRTGDGLYQWLPT
ncbi:chloramphenicol O-acetyltransferase [Geomicrobium halophilum]|uniref:Chloramphenicol O-acetyltransferase n=1 Tax=Geomicrobium halophilum TaxID=549000 RepID=A0A841PNI7_9BACL|nr:hypothetical protein [Geomicrobium halophilum]MBB6448766.1 chloramphenicol O-acetyltransferase [Geomicrobium halophilum]